jgi:hypothetical protein
MGLSIPELSRVWNAYLDHVWKDAHKPCQECSLLLRAYKQTAKYEVGSEHPAIALPGD